MWSNKNHPLIMIPVSKAAQYLVLGISKPTPPAIKQMPHEQFLAVMNDQIELTNKLFDQIDENDLLNKEVIYPWGGKAPFGEAIIDTSVKFLSGYKLQLFLLIRMCTDQKIGTPDAWFITELD